MGALDKAPVVAYLEPSISVTCWDAACYVIWPRVYRYWRDWQLVSLVSKVTLHDSHTINQWSVFKLRRASRREGNLTTGEPCGDTSR